MAHKRRVVARLRRRFAPGGPTPIQPVVVPGLTRQAGFFGRFGPGGELKFHDVTVSDSTMAANGQIVNSSVNLIPQGTAQDQRVGRQITIRQISWRFTLSMPEIDSAASAADSDNIRVILYLDKQCNGAAPAITDILATDHYLSFNNLANKSRFRTLMDRTYDLHYSAGAGNGTTSDWAGFGVRDDFFKKVNIPIQIAGTGTPTIANIQSNNIGVLVLTRVGLEGPGLASRMRLRFTDN